MCRSDLGCFPRSNLITNSVFEVLVEPRQFQACSAKRRHIRQALQHGYGSPILIALDAF